MSSVKEAIVASSTITITLASLASDSNLVAGRESTVIDNSSNLYLDYLISGWITAGTSPTAGRNIEIWAHGALNDTPAYVYPLTGSDAAATFDTRDSMAEAMVLLWATNVTGTSNKVYYMRPTSIAYAFNGWVPRKFGIFVVHNTAVNLNATAGNHVFKVEPKYLTVT